MNTTGNNNESLAITQDYEQSSKYFRSYWTDIQDTTELAKKEMMNMVTALEKAGFTRTQAIQKIVDDHKDLKGFSRRTIYRELPDNQKRKYDFTNVKSNVPNDTFENEDDDAEEQEQQEQQKSSSLTTAYDEMKKTTETEEQTIDDLDKYEQELQEPIQVTQFNFRTMLSIKDQEIPVIVTVYPDKKTGYVEVDEKLARKLRKF